MFHHFAHLRDSMSNVRLLFELLISKEESSSHCSVKIDTPMEMYSAKWRQISKIRSGMRKIVWSSIAVDQSQKTIQIQTFHTLVLS